MAIEKRRSVLTSLYHRAIATARQEGWAAVLRRAIARGWSLLHVTNQAVWYERDLDPVDLTSDRADSGPGGGGGRVGAVLRSPAEVAPRGTDEGAAPTSSAAPRIGSIDPTGSTMSSHSRQHGEMPHTRAFGAVGESAAQASLTIDGEHFEELLEWLRAGDKDYMYVPREIDVARLHAHAFLVARMDADIVGYIKVAFEAAYVGDYRRVIALPDGVAFICDTYVVPSARGRGIAGRLIAAAARVAERRGCRALRCHIPTWNVASQRAYAREGFRPIGTVRFDRILGLPLLTPRGFLLEKTTTSNGRVRRR